MIRNMKIRTRLFASFLLVLLFTVVISAVSIFCMQRANTRLNDMVNGTIAADTAIKKCRIKTNIAAKTLRDMVLDKDGQDYDSNLKVVEENLNGIDEEIANLKAIYTKEDGLVKKYENSMNSWFVIGAEILKVIDQDTDQARDVAAVMIREQCTPILKVLAGISEELDASTTEMKNLELKKSVNLSSLAIAVVIIMLGACVITGVVISAKTTESIIIPINEVESAAQQMANGNLNTVIKYTSKNELGQLAESMRVSMSTISGYIVDIGRAMEFMANKNFNVEPANPFIGDFKNIEKSITKFIINMCQTLENVQKSADIVDTAAGQVSLSSQALAQGSTQQAAEVQAMSTAISQIAEQVKKNASNANEVNDLAKVMSLEIVNGDAQMKNLMVAMQDIGNSSKKIAKIIKTIEDIAFQTNILSLNAAVEAARAGNAGKGFAVVADEVRNLANKSAEAAKNTTELISSSVQAVDKGTDIADSTAKALSGIVKGAENITGLISKISEASNEQTISTAKILGGIEQIVDVVQTNAATAEQSAASSEELSSQANVLENLVKGFNIKH